MKINRNFGSVSWVKTKYNDSYIEFYYPSNLEKESDIINFITNLENNYNTVKRRKKKGDSAILNSVIFTNDNDKLPIPKNLTLKWIVENVKRY